MQNLIVFYNPRALLDVTTARILPPAGSSARSSRQPRAGIGLPATTNCAGVAQGGKRLQLLHLPARV